MFCISWWLLDCLVFFSPYLQGSRIVSFRNMLLICVLIGVEYSESIDQNDQMFKPGWKDIFRMNQSELESEIRKVSRDPTLDPRRKAYLIQNLMTR